MLRRGVAVACLAVCISACAGPATEFPTVGSGDVAAEQERQLSYRLLSYVEQNSRLQSVYHRVAAANVEFCGKRVAGRLGIWAAAVKDVPERYRAVAQSTLKLDSDYPTIVAVFDGAPAARAGILAGDILLAVNGEAVPNDDVQAWLASRLETNSRANVRLDVFRSGKRIPVSILPEVACAHPVALAIDNDPNAFTDGKRIVVFSGLLRLAQNDAELATVLGHELAHINMGHIDKKTGNEIAGAIGGLVIDVALAVAGVNSQGAFSKGFGSAGRQAFATDFEREADYVGTYYVARAGYDPAQAERFWRTLAQENPQQIFFAGLHPTSPERFLLMQQANAEIANKRRLKMPLRPELKKEVIAAAAVVADGH